MFEEIEEVFPDQLEVEADPLEVSTISPVKETKEETTSILSTPELEVTDQTPENVDLSNALVLATFTPISTAISNEKEIQSIQKGYDEQIIAKSKFQQEFEQTLKRYEDTKQEISKVRKELQRLEKVQDLTQMKLQDFLKKKDNIIDSSTEIRLEEKITSLTTEASRLRRIPESVWNNLRNSFNNFQM
uniref:Uncharacterized protein n=1 Tax=Fagus sylvatica TaxID=28930 RepID=A0A2N9GGC8_FAGSY